MSWAENFPQGRGVCYEGDDPEGFAATIRREFGFDPSGSPYWDKDYLNCDPQYHDPFGRTHWFWCPSEHLDAIYGNDRFPMGS